LNVNVDLPFEIFEPLFSSDFSSSSIGGVGLSASADPNEALGRSIVFVLKKSSQLGYNEHFKISNRMWQKNLNF
jgi:hypothetical protein